MNINDLYITALTGNSDASQKMFQILHERFAMFLQLRVSNQQDREDLLQEILTVIATKYNIEEKKDNFGGWTYQIFENKVLNYYRQKKRQQEREKQVDIESISKSVKPDYLLRINLKKCLSELHKTNLRYANIVNLHYQGFSSDEICSEMKINKNSMYILLSRAREILRTCIENKKELQ